jgi:hypothetical protein
MHIRHRGWWSLGLLVLALMPFIKIYLTNPTASGGVETTGNAISAASSQYMGFLLNKEDLFNYFMEHYDKGFFKFEDEENYLYSTYITLDSMRELGNLDELSPTAVTRMISASQEYYDENKLANWFSPSYLYSYYAINEIFGKELSDEAREELAISVLRFKIEKSVFRALSDAGKPNLKETYYALMLLDAIDYDFSDVKRDVIGYINKERVYNEEDSYYITKIAVIIGEQSEIPRTTIIGCVIKQYIPFVDSNNCAKLLKEKNMLTYFPSAFLLIASYFMLTHRRHHGHRRRHH